MTDPSARSAPPLPDRRGAVPSAVAAELEQLLVVARESDLDAADRVASGVRWACEVLGAGLHPAQLCDAVAHVGPRTWDAVALAAGACSTIAGSDGDGDEARLAAVQLVACAMTASTTEAADRAADQGADTGAGPSETATPSGPGPVDRRGGDPFHELLEIALSGDPSATEQAWLAAVRTDVGLAEQALISAGAAAYHLDETRLVLPAQLRVCSDHGPWDSAAARLVARRIGSAPQDAEEASIRRADASVLAADAMERSPETFGRLARAGHERLSILATGIALTSRDVLGNLLLASLEDGLAPEDLVEAISLLRAAAFAITPITEDEERARAAVLACAGADALDRCVASAHSAELRYELALCAPDGPAAASLEPVAELWAPPFDDGALEDLEIALAEGDPDAAAEAASAVPPDDPTSVDAAWRAVTSAAVTDPSPSLRAITHVVAMERGFRTSSHPARIWFLAAGARLAGELATQDRPVADAAARHLARFD